MKKWSEFGVGFVFFFVLLTMGSAPSFAQPQDLVPPTINGIPFGKYLQSPGYISSLGATVTDFESNFGRCDAAKFDARMQVGQPQLAVKFPGKDTVPQWLEIVRVSGCDEAYLRGVFVALLSDNIKFFPLLTGNGIAGVLAQQEVIANLTTAERDVAKSAGCKDNEKVKIKRHDMVNPNIKRPAKTWDEVWQVENCKGQRQIKVSFKDDGNGKTSFTIHKTP